MGEGKNPLRSAKGAHLIATPTRPPRYPVDPAHGEAYYFTDGISADEMCRGSAVYIHPVTRKVVVAVGHAVTGRVGLRERGPPCTCT